MFKRDTFVVAIALALCAPLGALPGVAGGVRRACVIGFGV